MVQWIRVSKENGPENKSVLRVSIMFKKERRCHKNYKNYTSYNLVPCIDILWDSCKTPWSVGPEKRYYLRLDPKLGHGKLEIRQIPCACVECTNMLDKTWAPGVSHNQQTCYQPVVECT